MDMEEEVVAVTTAEGIMGITYITYIMCIITKTMEITILEFRILDFMVPEQAQRNFSSAWETLLRKLRKQDRPFVRATALRPACSILLCRQH